MFKLNLKINILNFKRKSVFLLFRNIFFSFQQNETAKDIAERKNLTDILEILNDPLYKKKSSSSKSKKDSKDVCIHDNNNKNNNNTNKNNSIK